MTKPPGRCNLGAMRLALLGPADGNVEALSGAARLVLDRREVDRAVYLGVDGALEALIGRWATDLVGEDPSEEGVFARAVRSSLQGSPEEIDRYIAAERERGRLRLFESLPEPGTRVIEMLGGALVVMIYDKALLDEEDMLPARVLVFGRSRSPIVKQVGQRWFLSPGSFAEPAGGLMILEDLDEGVILTCYDGALAEVRTERLPMLRGAKLRVSGAGA